MEKNGDLIQRLLPSFLPLAILTIKGAVLLEDKNPENGIQRFRFRNDANSRRPHQRRSNRLLRRR